MLIATEKIGSDTVEIVIGHDGAFVDLPGGIRPDPGDAPRENPERVLPSAAGSIAALLGLRFCGER